MKTTKKGSENQKHTSTRSWHLWWRK